MAVKVFCSVDGCGDFIREVTDFSSLTGKEICERCGERIDKIFKKMEDKQQEHETKLVAEYQKVMKKIAGLKTSYDKFHSEMTKLYQNEVAELKSMKENIIKND